MATRIEAILTKVRDTLADPLGERWSDARLIRLVSEAQEDIAKQTQILKGQVDVSLLIGQHTYDLPEDVWLITRATFDECPIKLVSYDKMDEFATKEVLNETRVNYQIRDYQLIDYRTRCWDTVEGDRIEALIYDRRDLSTIRVWPIPNEGIAENEYTFSNAGYLEDITYKSDTPFGVWTEAEVSDAFLSVLGVTTSGEALNYIITDPDSCNGLTLSTDLTFGSIYGVLGDITDTVKTVAFHGDELLGETVGIDDYTLDTPYGFATALYDPAIKTENFQDVYGVITSVSESKGVVRLWYIRVPPSVTSLQDALAIPSIFDVAIKHYVVANAFDDDMDTRFQEKSAKAFSYYERELAVIKRTDRHDGTRATQYTTTYRGPFE